MADDARYVREALAALGQVSNASVLVTEDGKLRTHDERFVKMFDLGERVFVEGSLAPVLSALVDSGAEPIATVLSLHGPGDRGDVALADGRSFEWQAIAGRDKTTCVWVFRSVAISTKLGDSRHADGPHIQARLLETEKLASMGLLAAGVAHEINNPLAYTLLNLERLRSGLRGVGRRMRETDAGLGLGGAVDHLLDSVEMCLEGCKRVQSIVQDLRQFSRSDDDSSRVPVDVRRVLEFAADMVGPEVRRRARVVRDLGEIPLVLASEGRLTQVFLNLLVNAVHAIPEGAPETNEIRLTTATDERGRVVVSVSDTGEGMTPAVMEQIFEPFYTTKPPGLGTGLGLAICRRIATSIGGEIGVESTVGQGSVFRLVLPAAVET